jgi:hypothetical protein
MNVDGKRIRIEPASNPSSVLSTFWKKKALCERSSGISESLAATDLGCPWTNDSRQEKRPKLGSLGLELAGCPDKLFTNCLVAGLPTWVGPQLFFHSYRRNLAQL